MPAKKKMGLNQRAVAANERKDAARSAAKSKKEQYDEDRYWAEQGEGHKTKAQAKRNEQEQRKQEAAAKRLEAKRLAQEEEEQMSKKKSDGPAKVTQREIQRTKDEEARQTQEVRQRQQMAQRREVGEEAYSQMVDVENLNVSNNELSASTVDAALGNLELVGAIDAAPAVKMTFKAFSDRELPGLKQDKPGLKQAQYRDALWKMWERSPENPKNQPKD